MPRTTYIYLFERVTNRQFSTILSGRRELKIGVSDKPIRRNKTVDRVITGKVILLNQYKVKAATTYESALHEKYKAHKFVPESKGKGGGVTEWLKLHSYQVEAIKKHLRKLERMTTKTKTPKYRFDFFSRHWILNVFLISILITTIIKLYKKYLNALS